MENMSKKEKIAWAGTLLMAVGVFLPIVSLPFVGSMSYFANGNGDGVIVLLAAGASAYLIKQNRYKYLFVTGGISAVMLLWVFIRLQNAISQAKELMAGTGEDDLFAGLAEAVGNSVQIQWGWAVLIAGALLLIWAAYVDYLEGVPATGAADEAQFSDGTSSETE